MTPVPLPALVRHPIVSVGPGPTASSRVNYYFKNFQCLLLTHLPLLTQQNWGNVLPRESAPSSAPGEPWCHTLYLKHRSRTLHAQILSAVFLWDFHSGSAHLIPCNGLRSDLGGAGPKR